MTDPALHTDPTLRHIAGCVLQKDGEILLVQEKSPAIYGKWNLPAGHVDSGETAEAAAIRETREETGFQVKIDKKVLTETSPSAPRVFHAYAAHIIGGQLRVDPNEILDAKWLSLTHIYQLQEAGKLRNEWMVRAIQNTLGLHSA